MKLKVILCYNWKNGHKYEGYNNKMCLKACQYFRKIVGCYEHGNELTDFIKFGRILDQLRYY
jgi:hypothetical protein